MDVIGTSLAGNEDRVEACVSTVDVERRGPSC